MISGYISKLLSTDTEEGRAINSRDCLLFFTAFRELSKDGPDATMHGILSFSIEMLFTGLSIVRKFLKLFLIQRFPKKKVVR